MSGEDSWGEKPSTDISGEIWADTPDKHDPDEHDAAGERRYTREGVIGSGGMGVVYAARDQLLRRQVALKVAHDPRLGRRMAREAWITAQLEHPGIVAVYDAGRGPDGRPWYTMRLIRGRTLQARLREASNLDERLALLPHFLAACQAVAYAHSVGIIHRDLKSANILVGEFGETQVADWGLARPVDEADEDWSTVLAHSPVTTQDGSVIGTVAVMSPEQARGERGDPRSDVWSLGMVLYELLAGRSAFVGDSGAEILKQVREGDVPPLASRMPGCPPELVAIVHKALEFDRSERYPSAGQLAGDVARYLGGRRVQAHDYTPTELLLRVLQLWRVPLAIGAVALLLVLMVGVVASVRTADERNRAQLAEAEARAALDVAARNLGEALVQQAITAVYRDARPEAEILAAHTLLQGESPQARGVLAAFGGDLRPERILTRPVPEGCEVFASFSKDSRSLLCQARNSVAVWEWRSGQRVWSRELEVFWAKWGMDARLFVLTRSNELYRFDATGRSESVIPFPSGGEVVLGSGVDDVRFSRGDVLMQVDVVSGQVSKHAACVAQAMSMLPGPGPALRRCTDDTLIRYSDQGEETGRWVIPEASRWSASARVGEVVYGGTHEGEVVVVDLQTGQHQAMNFGSGVLQLLPVPGTDLVMVRGERGGARIWDARRQVWLGRLPGEARHLSVGAAPGEVIVLGEEITVWRLPTALRPSAIQADAGLSSVDLSPSGDQLVWADGNGVAGVADLTTGEVLTRLSWQEGVVKGAVISADGRWLFSSGMERRGGQIFAVDGWQHSRHIPLSSGHSFRRVGALSSGLIWGLTYGNDSGVWDPGTGAEVLHLGVDNFFEGSSSPGLERAVFLSSDGGVWQLDDTPAIRSIGHDDQARAVDISADGQIVVLGHSEAVCLLDLDSGTASVCHPISGRLIDVALSPDDRMVAVGTLSGEISLVALDTGRPLAVLRGHTARVASLAFHPDGSLLVSGGWDEQIRLWDLTRLETPPQALVGHLEAAWGMGLEAALSAQQ